MSLHRFAVLTAQGASGINSAEYEALFAPELTVYEPYLVKPLSDKKLALQLLSELFERSGYPKYVHQYTDDQRTTLLLWEGKLMGPDQREFTLEGSLALTEGEDGLIHTIVSYLRPLQVGALIMKPMIASAAAILPEEYWKTSKPLSAN